MSIPLPARIGKYQLVEYLGGGMAEVYRSQDTLLGRWVALKLLSPQGNNEPDTRARFLQEAKMASSVVHDNIISVYDFGEERGRPFMVMEFLVGQSLRTVIDSGTAGDLENRLLMALQVARALGYIHQKKIIHRDVKPDNVHVDTSGRVKLMDFGIAKSEGASLTRAGFTLGTPYYMAPEQVMGQQVTPLVDIYAFGILMFELFTGEKPIQDRNVQVIFQRILHEPIDMKPLTNLGVPPRVVRLVQRCVAKNPSERWPSFDAVVAELESILQGDGTPSPAGTISLPGFLNSLPPSLRTQSGLVLVSLIGMLVVLSVLIVLARVVFHLI